MGAEFIPVVLIKNSCDRRTTAAVLLCRAGGARARREQMQRLASLWAASSFSPKAGCLPGELSHGLPTSSTLNLCLPVQADFRGLGQGQVCAKASGKRVWEEPASSEMPPVRETPLQPCLVGHFCLMLTAHSPVQSDGPLAPAGAAAGPTRCPACLSLSMRQTWTPAHNRAQLLVPPAKEPDAAIGKNCFTI